MDLPLSEKARKLPLVELMPYITDEYVPEQYDKYDITGMSNEELLAGCREIIREKLFDDLTNEALERQITALLAELPESRRRIFLMRWKDGMSNKEVAQALNISYKTVSTQIHRTVNFLQKKLGIF